MSDPETLKKLQKLAEERLQAGKVSTLDSYNERLTIVLTQTGDLCLTVTPGGVTFAGAGGGDHRPLTRTALLLLMTAIIEEGR